ncbi:MAG: enolase C-terminal domain-like protein [Hyphomicrobiaceae bacterium]
MTSSSTPVITNVSARAYCFPTDAPEADGTLTWSSTTMVVVRVSAAGHEGFGYSYASRAAVAVIDDVLAPIVEGGSAFDVPGHWNRMVAGVRNIGWRGVAACAISAVDVALWDLKAKVLGVPVVLLLGRMRDNVAIYGSGGFTSYDSARLAEQLGGWVEELGCRAVKMKIGSSPDADPERMACARRAIGDTELYIDANGAFVPKQALEMAERACELGVTWFEEPVSSDDLDGLRLLRDRAPAPVRIAAGEYGYDHFYFRRMLASEAVDVLQADATRCGGFTGFLKAAALAEAHGLALSAHTAPALHLHVAVAAPRVINVEWFHDHVRIEAAVLDGSPRPHGGMMHADLSRPGMGLEFKAQDAERLAA